MYKPNAANVSERQMDNVLLQQLPSKYYVDYTDVATNIQ